MKKSKNVFNVIVLADIHFGKKNDSKLYSDLQEYFIDEISNFEEEYGKIGMIVIAGDLFDRVIKMSESSSNYVIKFIQTLNDISLEKGIYFRLIKGTKGHDYSQLNNFIHLQSNNPLFKIITQRDKEIITYNKQEYKILYLPEEYPESYDEYYKEYIGIKMKYDFIFGHGMMDFVSFTGDENILKKIKRNESVHKVDIIDKMCDYFTVFGHIHDFKNYLEQDKIFYTGSFERFSFADKEDKGYLILRVNKVTKEKEALFVENENASTYFILNLEDYKFKNIEEKLKFIDKCKSKYNYVKIIVPENEDNKELLKKVVSADVSIQIKNPIEDEVIDERFSFLLKREFNVDESIAKYIEITTGKKIKPVDINKIISKNSN